MPLDSPPDVQIGDDPAWRPTVFDTATPPEAVQRGPRTLPRDGIEDLRWVIYLEGTDDPITYAQVYKLRACGPDVAPADRGAAVPLPAGEWQTRSRVIRGGEVIIRPGDQPLQVG